MTRRSWDTKLQHPGPVRPTRVALALVVGWLIIWVLYLLWGKP